MKNFDLLQGYKRFLKNSALRDEERNLIEDYSSIEQWLMKNEDNDELFKVLRIDAQYQTISKAARRGIRFKEISPFGTWDSKAVKDSMRLIETLNNAESVGDTDTYNVAKGLIGKMIKNLTKSGNTASLLYIIQRWMESDGEIMAAYKKCHKEVEELMSCSTEDEIAEVLDRHINRPTPKRNQPTICNMETMPEIFSALRKKAYDAKQDGDVATLRACIEETTKLYMQSYFYRPLFGEDDETHTYHAMLNLINKYINGIASDEEPSKYNPLDLIKIAVESSKETGDEDEES